MFRWGVSFGVKFGQLLVDQLTPYHKNFHLKYFDKKCNKTKKTNMQCIGTFCVHYALRNSLNKKLWNVFFFLLGLCERCQLLWAVDRVLPWGRRLQSLLRSSSLSGLSLWRGNEGHSPNWKPRTSGKGKTIWNK